MLKRIWAWFTGRWPYYKVRDFLLVEEFPGPPSFAYTFGSAILLIVALQAVTGIAQLFYYVPTIDHAYNSVAFLRRQVPFGWLVHNLHYWGANMMVIMVGLHMIQVYTWGAYKTQLTWLIGVVLLLMTMALSVTGATLLWDQKGYWAGEVSTSIAGEVPVVGGLLLTVLRGGHVMGQLALSRFFVFHIGIFAPLLALFIGAHVLSFRHTGIVGPWGPSRRDVTGRFWPDQAMKDVIVGSAVFFIILLLSVYWPPGFAGAADTLNTMYVPKPEWNFLFMYQALKYFRGPMEPVGAGGVPAILIGLLVILPFIDKDPERNPFKRPVAMACLFVYAGAVIALTILGYLSPGLAQMPAAPAKKITAGQAVKFPGARRGKELFQSQGCTLCHQINGKGGSTGPQLSGGTLSGKARKWVIDQLKNPKSHFPGSIMPAFAGLSESDLNALADYLFSVQGPAGKPGAAVARVSGAGMKAGPNIKVVPPQTIPRVPSGEAAFIVGNTRNGAELFGQQCRRCHGAGGKGNVPNPGSVSGKIPALAPIERGLFDPEPDVFARNIDKYIQHGALSPGPNPVFYMPDFGDSRSLTQQEIANIEAYVLEANGVDRGKLLNPGVRPGDFFIAAIIVFMIAISLVAFIAARSGRGGEGDRFEGGNSGN